MLRGWRNACSLSKAQIRPLKTSLLIGSQLTQVLTLAAKRKKDKTRNLAPSLIVCLSVLWPYRIARWPESCDNLALPFPRPCCDWQEPERIKKGQLPLIDFFIGVPIGKYEKHKIIFPKPFIYKIMRFTTNKRINKEETSMTMVCFGMSMIIYKRCGCK